MKSLLQIILSLSILVVPILSVPAASHNGMDVDQAAPVFPWGNTQIQAVRCYMAKPGMVMLVLEFDIPLEQKEFNGRSYALLKWILNNPIEVKVNESMFGTEGVLPAYGFNVNNFSLATLLPWPKLNLEALSISINKVGGSPIVDPNTLTLRGRDYDKTTLIVMPFMSLMTVEEFIEHFGAKDSLVEEIERRLKPAFAGMRESDIAHGDLALRNIGVIFKPSVSFTNYESALAAIANIVLYDFGSHNTKFLRPHEPLPYNETLNHVLGLVRKHIKPQGPRPQPRARIMPEASSENLAEVVCEPSPMKLPQNKKRIMGSPHAFYGEENSKKPKKEKKTCSRSLFERENGEDRDLDEPQPLF